MSTTFGNVCIGLKKEPNSAPAQTEAIFFNEKFPQNFKKNSENKEERIQASGSGDSGLFLENISRKRV